MGGFIRPQGLRTATEELMSELNPEEWVDGDAHVEKKIANRRNQFS